MSKNHSTDMVFLQTDLFGDASDVLAAVDTVNGISIETINLQPERMGDADWDSVIDQVLRAGKVITL